MSTSLGVVLAVELVGGPLCGEVFPVMLVGGDLPGRLPGFPAYRLTVRRGEVCYQWRE